MGHRHPRLAAAYLTCVVGIGAAVWVSAQGTPPADATVFRLYLLGHEVGLETDTQSLVAGGRHFASTFAYSDRGASVRLTASLDAGVDLAPRHLVVRGQTSRDGAVDSEVTVNAGRVRVRDGQNTTEADLSGKAIFPIDGYAPIGVQEQLIRYWRSRGRPAEIASGTAGAITITSRADEQVDIRGKTVPLERLAIDGAVWGRETAWVEPGGNLAALTTWAGGLPFEAVREGYQSRLDPFLEEVIRDRIFDLDRLAEDAPPDQAAGVALVGATVIDGTRRPPIPNATVIIRGDRIDGVGPSSRVRPPADLPTVDVHGMTIIAGLWDMHAHMSQIDWAPVYLASGVTTVRDVGGEMAFLTGVRDAIAAGAAPGPRMLLAGLIDGPGPQAFGAVLAGTADEGRQAVRHYKDEGFRQIDIYSHVTPAVAKAIAADAHRLGMSVTGHVPDGMTAEQALDVGFDQIEQVPIDAGSNGTAWSTLVALFVRHRTVLDPTVSWNELVQRAAGSPVSSVQPRVTRLPPSLARMIGGLTGTSSDAAAAHARLLDTLHGVRSALALGVKVVAGTDQGVPGFSLQRELELYVEGGMSPLEALQTATSVPAQIMKLDDSGTVEGGKRADLVVLTGNPLDNIANIGTAKWVVANGKLYDCAKLWRGAGFKDK